MKKEISEQTLLRRVNRKLKHENTILKKCRTNSRDYATLGDYYEVDFMRNTIEAAHVDLIRWAKEMGCIKDYEVIRDE